MGIRDVAKLLNRSEQAVRGYVRNDDLPHRREGAAARLVFDEAEVREWMARPETQAMMAYGERSRGRKPHAVA